MNTGLPLWPNINCCSGKRKVWNNACDIWGLSGFGSRPNTVLIYINDLTDKTRSKIRLFADDTAIYLAVSNLQYAQVLQQDLDHLHEWELQWYMEFNPSKCVVIHVTRARTPVPSE